MLSLTPLSTPLLDCASGIHVMLTQVLQDHEFQRIGGKEIIEVDVRVMAATHRDLELC